VYYNDDRDFCTPKALPNKYYKKYMINFKVFRKVYNKYGFSDSITTWNMMKDFLVDGYVANEIIYEMKRRRKYRFQ
jgi:hypothetical protein